MSDNNLDAPDSNTVIGLLSLYTTQTSRELHVNQRVDIGVHACNPNHLKCICGNETCFEITATIVLTQTQRSRESNFISLDITNSNIYVEETSTIICKECECIGPYNEFVERYKNSKESG